MYRLIINNPPPLDARTCGPSVVGRAHLWIEEPLHHLHMGLLIKGVKSLH